MNDKDIAEAVKQLLENRALAAPSPNGLLDDVKARSRRRGILRRITAGASALAVTGAAALLVGQVLQPAAGGDPDGGNDVRVCLDVRDGVPERLMIAERLDGHNGEAGVVEWPAGDSDPLELSTEQGKYEVTVKGWDVPVEELPLADAEDVEVDGRYGRLGTDTETGAPMVGFETGQRIGDVEVTLTVAVTDGDADERWLMNWANSITVHTKTEPCDP